MYPGRHPATQPKKMTDIYEKVKHTEFNIYHIVIAILISIIISSISTYLIIKGFEKENQNNPKIILEVGSTEIVTRTDPDYIRIGFVLRNEGDPSNIIGSALIVLEGYDVYGDQQLKFADSVYIDFYLKTDETIGFITQINEDIEYGMEKYIVIVEFDYNRGTLFKAFTMDENGEILE